MRNIKLSVALVAAISAFIFSSCTSILGPEQLNLDTDYQELIVNDSFSIKIPNYMEVSTDLNADASLQYQNALKETYMVIIDENKSTFSVLMSFFSNTDSTLSILENYANVQSSSLKEGIVISDSTEISSIKINGTNAYQIELEGEVEGVSVPIYYIVTFLESNEKLFMSMQWTLQSRKEKYRGTFLQTINTFKSLE